MSSTELGLTKMTKKHNVTLVLLPSIRTPSFWNKLYTILSDLTTAINNTSSTPTTSPPPIMPRKTVYVCTQTPKDLMAGLLEVVQNQSGDNHLTVSCMRAMNKYLTDNLRQSTARVNSRSTRRHICRICGSNIDDMANAVPGGKVNFEQPQNADDCGHQNPEDMEIDGENGEEWQDPIPRFEMEIPQVDLSALVTNGTAGQAAEEEYPSTEGSDEATNNPPQMETRTAQPQSGAVAGDAPSPTAEDTPRPDSNWFQGFRDVNQAFYESKDFDSSSDSSSQSPDNDGVRAQPSAVPKTNIPEAAPETVIQETAVQETLVPETLVPETLPRTMFKAVAKAASSPLRKTKTDPTRKVKSSPIAKAKTGPIRRIVFSPIREFVSEAIAETEPDLDETPFAPPCSVNQAFCVPNDSDSDTASEESSLPPHTPQNGGPPQNGSPGHTPFAVPRDANTAFCVADDSDSDTLSSSESQLGSSPPVRSNIPDSPAPHNPSFRDTPPTASFFQADSSSDGSEEETESDAEKDAQNATENATASNAKYRHFLGWIKKSLNQTFNPDETLSDLDTSSPCVRENDKAKENSPVPDNTEEATEEDTEEGTDEETNYDPDLIARSLLTSNPNRNVLIGERVSFTNSDTPSRPERPYRQGPTSAPHNSNLPTITVQNTDIDSEMTVDYQNSLAHDFGVRYGSLRARIRRADRNSLTVPMMDLRVRARNTSTQSPRSAAQHAERLPGEPGPSNLRREKRRRDDDDDAEEEEEEARTPKRVRFAFGTNEHEGNATWAPRRPLRPRRRVWFVNGKRVYQKPEGEE